jgi:hypothetical protein
MLVKSSTEDTQCLFLRSLTSLIPLTGAYVPVISQGNSLVLNVRSHYVTATSLEKACAVGWFTSRKLDNSVPGQAHKVHNLRPVSRVLKVGY